MSGYNKGKHRGLKGNILLTAATVLLGCAVIASSILLLKKTPAAKSALAGVSRQSSSVSQPSSKVSGASSPQSSSSVSSAVSASVASLDDALFIGDAFTDGLTVYGGIAKTSAISDNGMSAYTSVTRKYTIDGKKQIISDAAAAINPGSIYILLGSNDIAQGYSAAKYTKYYKQLIEGLKTNCPSAKIYVQSVFPVTAAYDAKQKSGGLTNEKIDGFNTELKSLCADEGAAYLDVASALKGSDGCLPSAASGDGFHIKKAYYAKWVSYLKTNP